VRIPLILSILFGFLLVSSLSFVYVEPAFGTMRYDLVPNADVEIVDLKIIYVDDNPKDAFDDSDVIVITFEITNRGIDDFILADKMFKILVLDPSFQVGEQKPENSFIISNYFTLYHSQLVTQYEDYPNLEIFKDCDYFRDSLSVDESKTYSVCFDVLRKWENEALNIDGPKHHFLVLMDNTKVNSCPNCIDNLLSTEMMNPSQVVESPKSKTNIPSWVKQVAEFWVSDQIDDSGFVQVIEYLIQQKIITIPYAEAPEGEAAAEIPIWIKMNAEFWVNGKTSDDEFATALEWLINNGIIRI